MKRLQGEEGRKGKGRRGEDGWREGWKGFVEPEPPPALSSPRASFLRRRRVMEEEDLAHERGQTREENSPNKEPKPRLGVRILRPWNPRNCSCLNVYLKRHIVCAA